MTRPTSLAECRRAPSEIDVDALYERLYDTISERTTGKGCEEGTEFVFDRADIHAALQRQNITPSETAMEYLAQRNILRCDADGRYHLVHERIAEYYRRRAQPLDMLQDTASPRPATPVV